MIWPENAGINVSINANLRLVPEMSAHTALVP
jgi:hypothetical protein